MLLSLTVSNFTVVKHLSLEFSGGFSAVTGETGAGKSIIMDALSLCLGERADPSKIRRGEDQSQISATFNVSKLTQAQTLLDDLGFQNDTPDECVIRRIINSNGRSKAFINGHPATLNDLQSLAHSLAIVCGQHAQYALLKHAEQRHLLDRYAQHDDLLQAMSEAHEHYHALLSQHQEAVEQQAQLEEKQQLLQYQLDELNALAPEPDEFTTLEAEHKKLSHGQETKSEALQCVFALKDCEDGDLLSQLRIIHKKLETLSEKDPQLQGIVDNFHGYVIEIEESANDIQHYADNIDLDPEHQAYIENRYSAFLDAARKHRIQPEMLADHWNNISDELEQLQQSQESFESLKEELEKAENVLLEAAVSLNRSRQAAADGLTKEITQGMPSLGMEKGSFSVQIEMATETEGTAAHGADRIDLQVQTNPGEEYAPLNKIASGGELSRISLLLQLAIAKKHTTPTLIFDEVDTGISGPTAAVVGELLQQLGGQTQVFSITHLPQVACHAHQQFFVAKNDVGDRIETDMRLLDSDGRELEIARLLGSNKTEKAALKNAQALLKNAQA